MRNVPAKKKRRSYVFRGGKGCIFFLLLAVLVLAAVGLRGCTGLKDSVLRQQYPVKYQDFVEEYAKEFALDADLVYAIIRTESRFDPYAVSNAGAKGLMQLQDETARDCAEKLQQDIQIPDDLYDPQINIMLGCYYFSHLLEQFDGDLDHAIMAYNGGPGNVRKWMQDDTLSGQDGVHTIPFEETENYVRRVKDAYQIYQNLY